MRASRWPQADYSDVSTQRRRDTESRDQPIAASAGPVLNGDVRRRVPAAAEFFQQPRHVRADRVQRGRPAERAGARAAHTLIERQRIGVRAQLLAGFVERHVAHVGRHREWLSDAFDDRVDGLVGFVVRVIDPGRLRARRRRARTGRRGRGRRRAASGSRRCR